MLHAVCFLHLTFDKKYFITLVKIFHPVYVSCIHTSDMSSVFPMLHICRMFYSNMKIMFNCEGLGSQDGG